MKSTAVNIACVGLVALTFGAQAQLAIPTLYQFGATDSTLEITAGQAVENVAQVWQRAESHLPIGRRDFPTDSIQRIACGQARRWLARLARVQEDGIQSESYMQLLTSATEDSLAERTIAVRLATRGLSKADQAYALAVAVSAFADPSSPKRILLAEGYLARLNAMGTVAAHRRYLAELAMVGAYDALARPADVGRHGIAAVSLVRFIPMKELLILHDPEVSPYPTIVRALAIQPNGRATIGMLNQTLVASTIPSPDSVALDSAFYYTPQYFAAGDAKMFKAFERVGNTGGPIESNRWLNRVDTTAATLPVNDGNVRVILVANYGCGICVFAAIQLQQVVDMDSAMRVVLVTHTDNSWANRLVTPDENGAFMTNFWVNEKQIHFPIALWIAKKTKTYSDGTVVADLSDDSTLTHYPETGKPQFYLLDGQGRIRATFFTFSRLVEEQIVTTVHRLKLEGMSVQAAVGQ